NELKQDLLSWHQNRKAEMGNKELSEKEKNEWIDITAPGTKFSQGHLHPITLAQRRAIEIFEGMGFGVAEGPEIESEWYNFDALNIPPNHPARDMWDTFWLKPRNANMLLRTHTSPVQVRYMEKNNPPLRIIAPGRVFRYEATDARHGFQLYQLEGLMVGKTVSVANFKAILREFYRRFFDSPVTLRLRPSYFPFVEPGFEVDMSCVFCKGNGCQSCGQAGWLEMMGAGMVHPKVFEAVKYIPKDWQGFAFGMGIDRLAMMKYKVNDIRLFYSGELGFLRQF
ncbi:MAG: phenylalanine--tRNA ligase subunit alpha, partial [Candidatus Wildermuthbacteria bacterium]|nr:phenylalanine--tRNA ligase subunit alpha [Candidatus Wildermuthbacteria bacterium]